MQQLIFVWRSVEYALTELNRISDIKNIDNHSQIFYFDGSITGSSKVAATGKVSMNQRRHIHTYLA